MKRTASPAASRSLFTGAGRVPRPRIVLLAVLRGFNAVGADMATKPKSANAIAGSRRLDYTVIAGPKATGFGNRNS